MFFFLFADIFKDGVVSVKIFRNTRYVDVVKRY